MPARARYSAIEACSTWSRSAESVHVGQICDVLDRAGIDPDRWAVATSPANSPETPNLGAGLAHITHTTGCVPALATGTHRLVTAFPRRTCP